MSELAARLNIESSLILPSMASNNENQNNQSNGESNHFDDQEEPGEKEWEYSRKSTNNPVPSAVPQCKENA